MNQFLVASLDDQGRAIWLSKSGNEGPCVANQQAPGGTERYALVSEYHPQGAPKQVTLGNGLVESYGFNNRLQATTLLAGALFSATLSYGAVNNGNPEGQSITRGGFSVAQSYGYDAVNRLKTASEGGNWAQTYVYDHRGNRAVKSDSTIPYSARTPQVSGDDASQELSLFPNNQWAAGAGNTFDLAGNLTVEMGGRNFTYDAENRLVTASVTVGGSTIVSNFVYDGQGRRIAKKVGTAETRYLYDGRGNLLVESGTATASNEVKYLTQDALGSTRLVTDGTGAEKECFDYFPFGEEISRNLGARPACYQDVVYPGVTAGGRQEQRFTGKERDAETGLDYFLARYYSGAQGRFTSADLPLIDQHADEPQSWNLYTYVRNNPLRHMDPTGRCLRPGATLEDCANYVIGGLKAVGNIPSATLNSPNVVANLLLSPFTDFRIPEIAPSYSASNQAQEEGMNAASMIMLVSPLAEAAASKFATPTMTTSAVSQPVTGGRLGGPSTRAQNSAIADNLESRGFTITGGGGRLKEEHLRGPGGGTKGGTFVDITAVRNGKTVRVQTIDTRADGITPTTNEAAAAARIRTQQKPGDHLVLIPKKK